MFDHREISFFLRFFNAKTQRRKDAEDKKKKTYCFYLFRKIWLIEKLLSFLCVFASLRLCVKKSVKLPLLCTPKRLFGFHQ